VNKIYSGFKKYSKIQIYFKLINNPDMRYLSVLLLLVTIPVSAQVYHPFQSSQLTGEEDLSEMMVNGMHRFLDQENIKAYHLRRDFWRADFSGDESYTRSVDVNRKHFAGITGVVDKRVPVVNMEVIAGNLNEPAIAQAKSFRIFNVRWNVFDNIHGEGLLLQPSGKIRFRIVVVPDADQTPEALCGISESGMQYARKLAGNGCQVIIPTIINRSSDLSGNPRLKISTNQPHREWIYRQAFTFGRHVIGYEIQKTLAAIDWFDQQNKHNPLPVGIAGWGEGGLIAFYSAAIDTRINAALVSGYFSRREDLWREPVYRNISRLLSEFGDAEIASLIIPRKLIIEYSDHPEIKISQKQGLRQIAAPGFIKTPDFTEVKSEYERAGDLAGIYRRSLSFIHDNGKTVTPFCDSSMIKFLASMDHSYVKLVKSGFLPARITEGEDPNERHHRQVKELEKHLQDLIETSRLTRNDFLWNKNKPSDASSWQTAMKSYREYFHEIIIGRIKGDFTNPIARSRQIIQDKDFVCHEIVLDILPEISLWGYMLLPNDMKPGEKRPVLVVQHGLGGVPSEMLDWKNGYYHGIARKLVSMGYVVFASHFPWRQAETYRSLQRKANPVGLSVFSFILLHHESLLRWLNSQEWVDASKIGFYGLSWGGKVAMRVPAILEGYSLSICSGDFNEWIWKNSSTGWPGTYMYAPEYEMFDYNLGMTFSHAEMAALIAPRAFMVERGHDDGVGIDEMVAFEYSKVKRLYDKLNIPGMTEIEYFNGGHEMYANQTLRFIERHFGLPSAKRNK
jgi:dienelactone hydrolase